MTLDEKHKDEPKIFEECTLPKNLNNISQGMIFKLNY